MADERPVNLKYVGDGSYVPGVPTTDMLGVEPDEAKRLIDTGLYRATVAMTPRKGEEQQPDVE